MKQMNRILWLAVVAFFLALLNLVFVIRTYSQDSVRLKIIYSKRIGDTVYYQFRILESREIVNSKCCCMTQHKKGEVITRAKKDLEFIKPGL